MKQALEILIVDDDSVDRQMVRRHLSASALEVTIHEAATASVGGELLCSRAIDCVLLDYRLPDADGIDLLRQLQSRIEHSAPPIIMLTGKGSESIAVEAMKAGCRDYLIKEDITPETLEKSIGSAMESAERCRDAADAQRELERLAMVDTITQIGNRHLFNVRLDHALNRVRRQSGNISLLLIDLDGFKAINDTWGHLAGDQVLREIAQRLQIAARKSDTVARLGGDEFAVLMETGTDDGGTALVAERLEVELTKPIHIEDAQVRVGVSIGAAMFPDDGTDAKCLIGAADAAMYEAKRAAKQRAARCLQAAL